MLSVTIEYIALKNRRNLLSEIKFNIEQKKVYTILGKNGSGKSTLIKSLTQLLDKRFYNVAGSVLFEDKNLLELTGNDLLNIRKDKIKYVFQDSVNSFDHLRTFKYYFNRLIKDQSELDPLLEYFLLPNSSELLPLYPYEVSGGMAQRINFILALLAHPKLIILDEPTSGIDPAIANLFLLKIKDFVEKENASALLVTHDILFAKSISDEMAYLNDGRLTKFCSPQEFFEIDDNSNLSNFIKSYSAISS